VFAVGFFSKDDTQEQSAKSLFDKALLHLQNNESVDSTSQHGQTNSLLTKCVIQVIGDSLKQFQAVLQSPA
jgi:hypothetical protein